MVFLPFEPWTSVGFAKLNARETAC